MRFSRTNMRLAAARCRSLSRKIGVQTAEFSITAFCWRNADSRKSRTYERHNAEIRLELFNLSQASAAVRGGDRARDHDLPLLLRCAASDRRGDARGSRRGPGLCAGEANHLPEVRLPDLRGSDRPGQEPAAPGRGWHGHDRARHPCRGVEVRLAYPPVSAGSDLCRSRRAARPLDPGAVDEAGRVVAEATL